MDDKSYKVVFGPQKIKPSKVFIEEISSTRNIDHNLEFLCKSDWINLKQESKRKGRLIWESEVYRFESINLTDGGLQLMVSTIPFSIRLTMNDHVKLVNQLGIKYAALGMYTSCFVVTLDNHYLFIEKSNKYHSNRKISFIGGILSKTEKELRSGNDLFEEVAKEVKEEIGVSSANIESIRLNAGYISKNFNFCLVFTVKIKKKLEEILRDFDHSNDGEAANIVYVKEEDLMIFAKERLPEKDFPKFEIMGLF